MSSFFTAPASQNKRKRPNGPEAPKKRLATASKKPLKGKNGRSSQSQPAPVPKTKRRETEEEEKESTSGGGSSSEGEIDDVDDGSDAGSSGDEGDAASRRRKLAERYLQRTKEEIAEVAGFDAEDVHRDLLAERIAEDVAETKGRVYRKVASELNLGAAMRVKFGWNTGTATSVAVCAPHAYMVSKDGYLVKWKIQDLPQHQWPQTTRKRPKKPPAPPKRKPEKVAWRRADHKRQKDRGFNGHTDGILAVEASHDGKYVVTGGLDRRVVIWDAETLRPIKTFAMHRDAVTGLAFRKGTTQLFSASRDRSVKVWQVGELAYVETLYGHQDDVTDVAALAQDRCVSVGARDRTARYWKVEQESQLVFRGGGPADKKKRGPQPADATDPRSLAHEGSMDRVALLDDELFVTGSDNGSIALWSIHKKKPLFTLPRAHGVEDPPNPADVSPEAEADPTLVSPPQPRWITALAALPYSDMVLSGSWDGYVRVWRLGADKKTLEAVGVLGRGPHVETEADVPNGQHAVVNPESTQPPIKGIVNSIAMFERGERGRDGLCVVIATGREIRLGRWKVLKGGNCGGFVYEIPRMPRQEMNGLNGDTQVDVST